MTPPKSAGNPLWLDYAFQKVQKTHRFLFRLICCCGLGEKCCFSHSSVFYADKIERKCCCLSDIYSPADMSEDVEDEYKPLYSHTNLFMNSLGRKDDLRLDTVWFAPGSTVHILMDKQELSFSHDNMLLERILSRDFPKGQEISSEYSLFKCFKIKRQVKLNIGLLAVNRGPCAPASIFWEMIEYKHLFISSKLPIHLTDKMLSCGFLYINALLTNPEVLETFGGFALLVRNSVFSTSRIIDEIEKMRQGSPSNLEMLSIIFETENSFEAGCQELLKHCGAESFLKWKAIYGNAFKYISLEKDNPDGPAIFICDCMIAFAATNWKKWPETLSSIPCMLFKSRDACW